MLDRETLLERELRAGLHAHLRIAVAYDGARPVQLTRAEDEHLRRLDHRRRARWLRGRSALKRATGGADTALFAFPNACVSLTHCGAWSVAVSVGAESRGVGVDLQLERGPSERTAELFLAPAEHAWFGRLAPARRAAALLRLWTVKEALFKADPDNASSWFTHYCASDPPRCTGWATRSDTGRQFRYASLAVRGGWLTTALVHLEHHPS